MRPVYRGIAAGAALLALLAGLLWQFSPAQSIIAVAHLSDPAKLATLGERGANSRLNKIVYWLHTAERRGLSAKTFIRCAQFFNGT